MTGSDATLSFAPLLPWPLVLALTLPAIAVLAFGIWRGARGIVWRSVAVAVLLLTLINPTFVLEDREYLASVAVVVLDESASQRIGQRTGRSEAALEHVRQSIEHMPNMELRVVRAGRADVTGPGSDGTNLFAAISRELSDVPRRRLAGTIVITDGQVHDAPVNPQQDVGGAPFHVLLSGERDERDRRLVLKQAPSYGIVGKELEFAIRVEELGSADSRESDGTSEAIVTMRRDGEPWRTVSVPVGRDYTVSFRLDHAGPTYFEMEAEAGQHELTLDNNRAVAAINGVRDRLRVLLISGEPHPGERTWRNLLKADPGVDLVHFTILRPPEKQDRTPVSELSLISFPVHELFDIKLAEFDLIIFDRYRRRGVLLNRYLDNIAAYVEDGGALLVAVGPTFAEGFSLFNTPLGRVLPAIPTRRVMIDGFRPRVTTKGARHPVTAGLTGANDPNAPAGAANQEPAWGRWFRHVDVDPARGTTLMTGAAGRPLIIADRVGDGRVMQILSDHVWLWSRGFEGGGPQAELLRRTAHWLMKEPELEEDVLRAEVRGNRLEIQRRSLEPDESPVEITSPSGSTVTASLSETNAGLARGAITIEEAGVYRIRDGSRSALAAAGRLNPREVADMRTTADLLRPIVQARGGAMNWLVDGPSPDVRAVRPGRDMASSVRPGRPSWLGLRNDPDYLVTGVREVSLLPGLLVLLLGLGGMIAAWRREGE